MPMCSIRKSIMPYLVIAMSYTAGGNAVGTVGEGAGATTTRANAAIGGMELYGIVSRGFKYVEFGHVDCDLSALFVMGIVA
jgi:hypothetical protein